MLVTSTLWWTYKKQLNMAIEIVDFPIQKGGSFHGKMLVHQRVNPIIIPLNHHKIPLNPISFVDPLVDFPSCRSIS